MKNKITTLFILLFVNQVILSQEKPFFKGYNWDEKPTYEQPKNEKEEMLAVREKVVTEFYFEGESFVEYFLEHKVLWLNSDDKIEEYNKVYLPFSSSSFLEVNKARVITKEGKVINLDESKILTAEDEGTGRKYKYFAFEGITKGSYIEYIYVVKRVPIYKGLRLNLQASYNKKRFEFDLFSPKNLIFKFKSLNKIPQIKKDTNIVNKQHWSLAVDDLNKIENEDYAAYKASKGSIVYKLDKNTANKATDISSYSKVAQNIHAYYYGELEKKESKKINGFISELGLNREDKEEELIRELDYYIKTNIFISEDSGKELSDLNQITEKRVMNATGSIKLYVNILKKLGIKHEIVITSDRRKIKFDKKFEANNFLNDFLIYFPKTKKYLSPTKVESRFGFPPAFNTDNYGLFIKEVTIGDFKSAVGKIKYIKPIKSEETSDKMLLNIKFNPENIAESKIHLEREFLGYYAMSMQPFIHLIKGEDKEKLIHSMGESISKEIEVKKAKILNDKPELFGVSPLKFILDIETEALVEKAGRKYLFKLGDVIGKQIQLYQKKKRILNLEEEYQREYYRTINITIPEGYKISNLKDISIDNSYSEDDKVFFSFKSSYKLTGNVLTVTADEFYKKNIVDVSLYEEYRKVINSAADFNKIVLLLEPINK